MLARRCHVNGVIYRWHMKFCASNDTTVPPAIDHDITETAPPRQLFQSDGQPTQVGIQH